MVNSANELPAIADPAVKLVRDERGLALVGDGMELRCDLARMLPRIKPGKLQHELLVKAAKVKGATAPRAIDATAGFGEDALLLAAAGFDVQLYEADPVIAALLADGLERAAADAQLAPFIARMHLTQGDSVAALRALTNANCEQPDSEDSTAGELSAIQQPAYLATSEREAAGAPAPTAAPDVIYLDPMFPARQKSAAVKKKFQLLHHLEAPCANEEELLLAAIAANPRKVIIKRPIKGPLLAGIKQSCSLRLHHARQHQVVASSYNKSKHREKSAHTSALFLCPILFGRRKSHFHLRIYISSMCICSLSVIPILTAKKEGLPARTALLSLFQPLVMRVRIHLHSHHEQLPQRA